MADHTKTGRTDVYAGWKIHHGAVPAGLCEDARRRLWLEVRRCGLAVADMRTWARTTWWPSLRDEPVLDDVRSHVEALADTSGSWTWAETQILVRLPDEAHTTAGGPHVDELPPWAPTGARYRAIYGVELTDSPGVHGGGTHLELNGRCVFRPRLFTGDVLQMDADLPHSGSPNRSADVRMALFYRQIDLPDEPPRLAAKRELVGVGAP